VYVDPQQHLLEQLLGAALHSLNSRQVRSEQRVVEERAAQQRKHGAQQHPDHVQLHDCGGGWVHRTQALLSSLQEPS
jgi:hypothetical protein